MSVVNRSQYEEPFKAIRLNQSSRASQHNTERMVQSRVKGILGQENN